jgi:DNA-binding transcriptional ArsR family regulator
MIINNDRKIIEENGFRLLAVSSKEDIKIISSPQRQRIFKLLQMSDRPLHGKEIADKIGVKAPSAHFHIRKLEEIGAVKVSHTQSINGITATYYESAVDIMMTGEDFLTSSDDEHIRDKLLFTANVFNEAKASFINALGKKLRADTQSHESDNFAMLLNAAIYLSPEDMELFADEVNILLKKYAEHSPNKQLYAMLLSVSEIEN